MALFKINCFPTPLSKSLLRGRRDTYLESLLCRGYCAHILLNVSMNIK